MRSTVAISLLAVGLSALACGGPSRLQAPPSTGFELPALGIRVDALPAGLVRAGDGVLVVPAEPNRGGTIRFQAAPPEDGVNLIEAVHRHQTWIETQPEGRYSGAQELVTPLGTAFWSRGRWRDESGGEVEESIALALHPDRARILGLRYRYPAGDDSSQRVTELLELLSAVEGLPQDAGETAGR